MPMDHKRPVDMKQVIARIADDSDFLEFGENYGSARRSRGSSWPRFSKRSREAADFSAVRVSTSRTRPISSSMPARLAWKGSLLAEMVVSMMAMVNAG